MSWLALGLLSTMLFGLIGTVDKLVLSRYFTNHWAYPFFTSLFFGLYCSIIFLYRIQSGQFYSPSISVTLMALIPGIAHFIGALFFTRALIVLDASVMFGIIQINPIFAILWGWLFFGEIYKPINYAGILLIVVSAVLLSLERTPDVKHKFHFSKALIFVVLGTFFKSLSDLFIKLALTDLAYWDAFSISRMGLLFAALTLLLNKNIRCQIINPIKEHGKKVILIAGVIEFGAVINSMLIVLAFSLGPLALVSTTQATMPMFVLGFTQLINIFKPGLVPVKDYAINTFGKIVLCTCIIAGVFLIYQYQ